MMPQEYRDFFVAAAGATGALTGLLFVALSLSPRRAAGPAGGTWFRTRASAALLVFTDALVLSLAALVPGVALGWWSAAGGVGVLAFALAALRVREEGRQGAAGRPYGLAAGLLCIVVFEIWAGVRLLRAPSDLGAVRVLCYLVVADLIFGVAQAWELASMRDTGLITSLRLLVRGEETGPAAVAQRVSDDPEDERPPGG
ncbi:hypothetical protein GCM10018793_61590 [Streptomyces sulfonofaciens]|uniref:Uncharacterized protein n=1 Tax=Streptomyces sulfonofaciens TaxID=68272 RepID=A0A919GM51_9ACTN|nr:hypothetical protein [Streptomyces sulfonofaciens]GHH87107.1 hypothetical protein GCM10018793_61590 [Streptomyces sulfonofaciens]